MNRSSSKHNIPAKREWWRTRRGVAAVLAMMFLILFGSLSAAMAIASKGNITTAATHLHVGRAQSAAETGLAVAKARLAEAANQFLISESTVDATFGTNLWQGNLGSLGTTQVLPPKTGRQDGSMPGGLAAAVAAAHALDQDIVTQIGVSTPTIANRQAGASTSEYAASYWVYTPAVALESRRTGETLPPLAYSITYAPLANGTDVRAIVTGYDLSYSRAGQFVTRTIMQDFRMAKRVKHAIVSSSRVMIGKNVLVSGGMGLRYTGVTYNNGDPLVLKSDFKGLSSVLDNKLNAFYAGLGTYDVDGDNRLRVGHPTESQGIPSGTTDYDGDGQPDNAFQDVTGDGFVDELDIFIRQYDRNGDGKVTLSSALTAGTPAAGLTPEFTADDDLALLIDSSNPDRNKNGVYGFVDSNGNGKWDVGEAFLDYDPVLNVNRDQVLGYRDGFIDKKDQYAKVSGKLTFRATQAAWAAAQGPPSAKMRGPLRPDEGESAVSYGATDSELPSVNTSIFTSTQTRLQSAADGDPFDRQVASNLGISTTQLATYIETRAAGGTVPRYLRLDRDTNNDGLPDNSSTAYFEKMPFNSPSYSDWYYRPVYENMVFRDVQIPMGNNGLFRNCTFIGVTWVRSDTANTHVLWGEYGKMQLDATTHRPKPAVTRTIYGDDTTETSYPSMLPSTAIPPQQMILMAQTPMDKADIPNSQVSGTVGYNLLPNPLVIDGKRVTDTKSRSNNIRFHDCLFVGSIVSDAPQNYTQSRNKMQFTGKTRFVSAHPDHPDDAAYNPQSADKAEIAKSSMMLPGYSVDLGSFNSPPEQNLQLKGAIIAGVMDVRGNASIDGALLMTFSPTLGQAPLIDANGNAMGNPAGFNTTLGYFGPTDGDSESLDPSTLPVVNGQRIVGWDTDGDGLADVGADQSQPTGSTAVPFYGYGRVQLRWDPKMALPNGIMLPMQMDVLAGTYQEGGL
ncbi:MAG: hypothetical protein JSR77_17675 [Planctomycetes bacterium]|nr:hypothetical protein [Planctomycetota bacterium]